MRSSSSEFVDERLRASDDDQKLRRPRASSRSRLRLLPLLALVMLAAVPLLLLSHPKSTPTRAQPEAEPTAAAAIGHVSAVGHVSTVVTEPELAAPPAPPAVSSVSASISGGPGRLPPYSAQADCRRDYDRDGRGDGFARCGSSCCRSHAGISCYYLADSGHCDRFLNDGGGGQGGGGGAGREDADDGTEADNQAAGAAGARGAGDGGPDPLEAAVAQQQPRPHDASSAALVDPAAASVAAASLSAAAAAKAAFAPESVRRLVPMLPERDPSAARRPRMLRYPLYNLTWTRGAPPVRADGWVPTEAQRARLPARDLKELYYASCAVVGSSGTLRRSNYGKFIDAHELVMRFNGAPAGGGFATDVGARTTLSVLADVATTECVDGRARQPTLDHTAARLEGHLLQEPAPGWRAVSGCTYYPEAEPPPMMLFLPRRGGVRRLLEYAIAHAAEPIYIRSDALGDEVDAQIGAYADDTSHPTSGFNGVALALHICETVDVYGFGTPRDKFYSPPRAEKAGTQHLYRTEMRWLLVRACAADPRARLSLRAHPLPWGAGG
jgi:hypothetical protein